MPKTAKEYIPHKLPENWDAWLSQKKTQGSFLQSRHWADLDQDTNGNQQFVVQNKSPNGDIEIFALFSLEKNGLARTVRGPIVSNVENTTDISTFIKKIEKTAREYKAKKVRIEGFPAPRNWPKQFQDKLNHILIKRKYTHQPWMTSLIDISVGKDDLFNGLKHSIRKGIRKCEKDGIRIEECYNENDFVEKFWHSYYEKNPNDERARQIWNHPTSRFYRYFIAVDSQGTVLSCLGAYDFNGIVTEIASHRTAASYKIKAPVQDYLHWEMFKVYMETGARYFDLAGYNPNPIDSKEAGIAA
jgi:lipid II:glycine glycyltransferase (peptidoglycan interpeptide bridge formation enzyme)